MARLRTKYRPNDPTDVLGSDTAAGVPLAATEAGASGPSMGAPAFSPDAERLERMAERIDVPGTSAVDDAIDTARDAGVDLDRNADVEVHVEADPLDKVNLPPLTKQWLRANPACMYDAELNAKRQA